MVHLTSLLILLVSLLLGAVNAAYVGQRLQGYPYFVGYNHRGAVMTPVRQENPIPDYVEQDLSWLANFPMEKLYQYQNRGWVGGKRK